MSKPHYWVQYNLIEISANSKYRGNGVLFPRWRLRFDNCISARQASGTYAGNSTLFDTLSLEIFSLPMILGDVSKTCDGVVVFSGKCLQTIITMSR